MNYHKSRLACKVFIAIESTLSARRVLLGVDPRNDKETEISEGA